MLTMTGPTSRLPRRSVPSTVGRRPSRDKWDVDAFPPDHGDCVEWDVCFVDFVWIRVLPSREQDASFDRRIRDRVAPKPHAMAIELAVIAAAVVTLFAETIAASTTLHFAPPAFVDKTAIATSMAVADVNGDGALDILAATRRASPFTTVTCAAAC
jgi:hypothetical protein